MQISYKHILFNPLLFHFKLAVKVEGINYKFRPFNYLLSNFVNFFSAINAPVIMVGETVICISSSRVEELTFVDAHNKTALKTAVHGQDIVYINLAGDLEAPIK